MNKSLIPIDFEVPQELESDKFKLKPLTVDYLDKDYEAVMTSLDHLKGFFGERSKWPATDLSREQDLEDLKWHQEEFEARSSFAYTVLNKDESQVIGCVYIFPSRKEGYETDIYCWVRKSEFEKGLDPILFNTIKSWVNEKWPFKKIRYPGRE